MKHWLLSPDRYTVHLQSLICNHKKLTHNKAGNLHPLKVLMKSWKPVKGPTVSVFLLEKAVQTATSTTRMSPCWGTWHFLCTDTKMHLLWEPQSSKLWVFYSYSWVFRGSGFHLGALTFQDQVLPRELNKQHLIIKKIRAKGDCSWRGHWILATLCQTCERVKGKWYVQSVCFGLVGTEKRRKCFSLWTRPGSHRGPDTLNLWVISLPPYWAHRC